MPLAGCLGGVAWLFCRARPTPHTLRLRTRRTLPSGGAHDKQQHKRLSKPYSCVFLGSQLAAIISGPLAAGLLSINAGGVPGWRWLFIVEGLASVVLGGLLALLLPAAPLSTWWLPEAEREALHLAVRACVCCSSLRKRGREG